MKQGLGAKFKVAVLGQVNRYSKKHFDLQKLSGGIPQNHLTSP
jgi:hypothetical protein